MHIPACVPMNKVAIRVTVRICFIDMFYLRISDTLINSKGIIAGLVHHLSSKILRMRIHLEIATYWPHIHTVTCVVVC
jgi:hypothetical protein